MPAAQAVQLEALAAEYLPGEQGTAAAESAGQKKPGGHSALATDVVLQNQPAAQLTQLVAPDPVWKKPARQALQLAAPDEA